MPVYNKIAHGIDEVDVIIAGGGAAGCVVAGRLAAADPEMSVLLIEGGENNYMKENVINPALFREHLFPASKTAIFYKGTKQPQLANREPIIPAGGILGGGSSINLMLYTRAQRSDFDSWETEGWSAEDIIPHLKNIETFHGPGNKAVHGYDGPVQISDGGYKVVKTETDMLEAAKKCGFPEFEDLQDLDSNNGFAKWLRHVSPEGRRQDSAHTFVHPLLQDGKHPNLHVLCESKVNRVIFDDNKRASGVEYVPNPDYQPMISETMPIKKVVKARKLVVLSTGACQTPSVLERSGVGSAEILKKHNIPVVADLEGVGGNYQDHNLVFYPFRTNLDETETIDAFFSGRIPRDEAISKKMDLLRWNSCDVSGKCVPTEEEAKALGPEFHEMWKKDFRDKPNRPLMLFSFVSSYIGDQSMVEEGQYVSMAAFTAYPYSRGSIHIKGPEWSDGSDFSLGFFTDPHDIDLKKHIWAYKKQREIMRRTNLYQGEVQLGHPVFPEGSPAACVDLRGSTSHQTNGEIRDIEYSAEDDAAIIKFLRENIQTTWHSLGTCAMRPKANKGVVDKNLNVYDVKGLKCCDLSIVPENVAANTLNTALVVGEKGSSIILKELGLSPPSNKLFKQPLQA